MDDTGNKALAAARRVRAVELKTAENTYAQVPEELGYSSRGTAYNVVTKALRDRTGPPRRDGDLQDLENARLDALRVVLRDAAMTGDLGAAVAVVKIVQARAHLNGLEPARGDCEARSRTRRLVVPPAS